MAGSNEVELLRAHARYLRERLALMRARMYRLGSGSDERLREMQRQLEVTEGRLRELRRREAP